MSRSILWFRQDLRLHDNEALLEAARNADELIPVYIFHVHPKRMGVSRATFLIESVIDLRRQLRALGSDLIVRIGKPDELLYQLAMDTRSQWVYCNRERTRDEVNLQDSLEQKLWTVGRELRYTRGKMLFYTSDLPFPVTHCPDTWFAFRKEVEHIIPVRQPLEVPQTIPSLPDNLVPGEIPGLHDILPHTPVSSTHYFKGGETAGLQFLDNQDFPNETGMLAGDGKLLSPWISMGCLSPKKVYYSALATGPGGEEIRLNLFYRDYLRLMGKKYGDRIFFKSGLRSRKLITESNPEALLKWKSGNTGVPIIDAAMHQLNMTGWIPDILRRTVANYFIKVLKLDWRLGAAYFESTLIDYDPCSNWVSWLNLAGNGPDSREDRIIHYDVVGKKIDPDGSYVRTWNR